jgi:hypothetical protein
MNRCTSPAPSSSLPGSRAMHEGHSSGRRRDLQDRRRMTHFSRLAPGHADGEHHRADHRRRRGHPSAQDGQPPLRRRRLGGGAAAQLGQPPQLGRHAGRDDHPGAAAAGVLANCSASSRQVSLRPYSTSTFRPGGSARAVRSRSGVAWSIARWLIASAPASRVMQQDRPGARPFPISVRRPVPGRANRTGPNGSSGSRAAATAGPVGPSERLTFAGPWA